MRARRSLPSGYVLGGTLRLRGNRKLWLILSLLTVPWTFLSVGSVSWLASLVRPHGWTFDSREMPSPVAGVTMAVGGLLVTIAVTVCVHEAVHGILMWLFTGARPVFGFKIWYVYTDAPGWYFKRFPMVIVLLSPLIVLPAVGLPVIALAPAGVSLLVLFGLVINAISAIADVYMAGLALRIRGPVYFGDTPDAKPGEAGSWYLPAPTNPATS